MDYNRFRILYSLYNKHYSMQFGWHNVSSLYMEEDLKYIPEKTFYGDIVYLSRKRYTESESTDPDRVRISGDGIDLIEEILDQFYQYLGKVTDEESKYEYRHLIAMADDADALRSQTYFYIKERKNFFKQFLLLRNEFRSSRLSSSANPLSQNMNNADDEKELNRNGMTSMKTKRWDAFISHASEDKDAVVRPLCNLLVEKSLSVWYDGFTLTVGDSLRRSIDTGLSKSVCGIVILSKNFFSKQWPEHELRGLYARATSSNKKIILPVWYDVTKKEVIDYSPTLVDLLALSTKEKSLEQIAEALNTEIRILKVAP